MIMLATDRNILLPVVLGIIMFNIKMMAAQTSEPVCSGGCGNGQCTSPGQCTCPRGYTGQSCRTPVCSGGCGNGQCTSPDRCSCPPGYTGQSCRTPVCSGGCGNGQCTRPAQCTCLPGWTGTTCRNPVCSGGCGNGQCTRPGRCTCAPGWTGTTCRNPVCSGGCGNGQCTRPGQCTCSPRWAGQSCRTPVCSGGCGNGHCSTPNQCRCNHGYKGPNCGSATCRVMACPTNAYCQEGIGYSAAECFCNDGYRRHQGSYRFSCLATCDAPSCDANTDCTEGRENIEAKCKCKTGYRTYNNKCIETCILKNCWAHSHCTNGTGDTEASCPCNSGYIADGEQCLARGGVITIDHNTAFDDDTNDDVSNFQNLIDDNVDTSWTPNSSSAPWSLTIDMGGAYTITGIDLICEGKVKKFQLELSNDKAKWSSLTTVTDAVLKPREMKSFTGFEEVGSGRYCKFTILETKENWQSPSIIQLNLLGSKDLSARVGVITIDPNTAFDDETNDDVSNLQNLIDDNVDTSWTPNSSSAPWSLIIDMGGAYTITGIDLICEGRMKKFQLELSNDKEYWASLTTITDAVFKPRESKSFTGFEEVGSGRYCKFTILETNPNGQSPSIIQLNLLGSKDLSAAVYWGVGISLPILLFFIVICVLVNKYRNAGAVFNNSSDNANRAMTSVVAENGQQEGRVARPGSSHLYENPDDHLGNTATQGRMDRPGFSHEYENPDDYVDQIGNMAAQGRLARPGFSHYYEDPDAYGNRLGNTAF